MPPLQELAEGGTPQEATGDDNTVDSEGFVPEGNLE